MSGTGEGTRVRTRAVVVEPASMIVLWANEAALGAGAGMAAGVLVGSSADLAVPMAGELGIAEAIARVATTGEPHYARADLIPTRRGSMTLSISLDRLPDGSVLVLIENAWQHGARGESGPRERSRNRR